MSESVYKVGRRKGFTVVYRSVAQDQRLSLKARGLFLLIQSLPDDWKFTVSGMATLAGTGKDQIRSSLKELKEMGYIVKEQSHDGSGKFSGNTFVLQEEAPLSPLSENPTTVDTEIEPSSENPTTVDTEIEPSSENPMTGKPDDGKTVNGKPDANKIIINKRINKPPIVPQGTDTLWTLFDRFWKAYPRKENKARARKAWAKLAPDMALCRRMSAALEAQKCSEQWQRENGRYIPHPASWLNGRRWEDEAPAPAPTRQEIPLDDERRGRYL